MGDLRRSSEDPPLLGVEVEGPVDDARVPAARVLRDGLLALDHRDPAVVSRSEPVAEGRAEDSPANDGDIPGVHGALSIPRRRFRLSGTGP